MYDTKLELKDQGAVTASGFATVGGNPRELDMGKGLLRGRLVIDVSAIEVDDGDEVYQIHLLGASEETNDEISLCVLELGAAGATEGNIDSEIGRYEVPVTNEKNGTIYENLRVRHVILGTVSTGIDYSARLEEL